MLFNIPQFVDVEDKIVGPLTGKQLLWMFGLGAVLLVLWNTLEQGAFFITAVPVSFIFLAFAFYRPHNQPLIKFIGFGLFFIIRPKIYIWKKEGDSLKKVITKKEKSAIIENRKEKNLTIEEIRKLANTLDRKS